MKYAILEGIYGEHTYYKSPTDMGVNMVGNCIVDEDDVIEFLKNEQVTKRCAILCYDEEASLLKNELLLPIGKKDDKIAHARTLFSRLRECDHIKPDVIYAHMPDREGLGLALYNRMIRAAAHTVLKIDNKL